MILAYSLFASNAFQFVQDVDGMIGMVGFFHLIDKTNSFFIYSNSIFYECITIIVIEVMPDNILHFMWEFILHDDPQFLLYKVVDEIHALLNIIFVIAAFDCHHDVEKFIKRSCIFSQNLLHIEALVGIQASEMHRFDFDQEFIELFLLIAFLLLEALVLQNQKSAYLAQLPLSLQYYLPKSEVDFLSNLIKGTIDDLQVSVLFSSESLKILGALGSELDQLLLPLSLSLLFTSAIMADSGYVAQLLLHPIKRTPKCLGCEFFSFKYRLALLDAS